MPWNLPTNVDESWTHHPSSRCRSTPAGYRSLAVPCQSFCCCCFVLFFLLMLKVFVFRWTTVYSWDQWRLSPQSLRRQVRGSFHIPLLKLLLLLLMFLFATRWWRWWLFVVRVLPLSEKVACSHTQWLRGGRRRTCGGETRDKTRVGENAENFKLTVRYCIF